MFNFIEAFSVFDKMDNSSLKIAIEVGDSDYKAIKSCRKNVPKVIGQEIVFDPVGVCTRRNNYAFNLV